MKNITLPIGWVLRFKEYPDYSDKTPWRLYFDSTLETVLCYGPDEYDMKVRYHVADDPIAMKKVDIHIDNYIVQRENDRKRKQQETIAGWAADEKLKAAKANAAILG